MQLAANASPRVSSLAQWLAGRPEELAFNSVRSLAQQSGANANTVVRLSRTLGFAGYEECRRAVQDALRNTSEVYGQRAKALSQGGCDGVLTRIHEAGRQNLDALFSANGQAAINRAAELMLGARHVHVIGVRSCFAVADYMLYTARMAFDNFGERAGAPGDIRDRIGATTPEDVVMSITFPHYSVETIAAHELAQRRGARTIAVTDGPASPIALGAEVLICPQMQGPQHLPSLLTAFALTEAIVTAMVARSDSAPDRIMSFEKRLLESGAYRA
ncbi:MurR/RpiR family transcriptional regulator [Lutimaribacter sp. EGI FJ00015]|uniref:MurR/RpiR family transcriptional regulator n=1 Tax=Lutimaribacter degradans TaxID=2945989 RepID=A0ACC5ZSK2_9RHOB|nr:MurR/RpiR family transcriptional regulator [Lutimaribacter sp. EGI FJ00013]MCM2561304.1 MurR/RpiR family transcriptional regulator [Lutimaribacter sp. EGI FJ00013]MCO0611745.1 MurR/RpiR family transcriptional regulator [Lutimaribacter sp. EGI FJ00015]